MYSIHLSVGKNCTSGSRPIAGSSSFSQAFLLRLLSVCESFIKHQLDWQLIISLFLYIHRVLILFLPSIFVNSLISPSWLCFFVQSFLLTWLIIPSTSFLSICLEHIRMQLVFWSSFFSSQNQPQFLYLDVYIDISLFQRVKCLLFLLFYLIHFPFLQFERPLSPELPLVLLTQERFHCQLKLLFKVHFLMSMTGGCITKCYNMVLTLLGPYQGTLLPLSNCWYMF